MHTKFWSENLKGRDHLENLGTNRMIIFNWIFGKQCEVVDGSGSGPVTGSCERSTESSGSIRDGEILD
jgi:hypothetical protein